MIRYAENTLHAFYSFVIGNSEDLTSTLKYKTISIQIVTFSINMKMDR